MTCEDCEKEQNETSPSIAYFRIEEANIGLIGCKKHLLMAMERLRRHQIEEAKK